MPRVRFRFKQLVVYQAALRFYAWSIRAAERIPKNRFFLLDQFVRTALSIMLNIAEGAGLWRLGNKRKHYEIARGSTFEAAAILDALRVTGVISGAEFERQEEELAGIGAMLTRLVQRYERGGEKTGQPANGPGQGSP